ncbi:YeeE/YedE family protein [Halioxenophilus aromaticivorans]|uniref:YeeE/YedE family protein n=1 Tax=Halioxenophilus aromaticivorans TaxID=1306992 RepID=A0AAV3U4Z1_9ALTE
MSIATDTQILQGFLGGLLIGSAALLLLLGKGYIAGISGIVGRAVTSPRNGGWRWLFIAGLLCGSAIYFLINGSLNAQLPTLDVTLLLAAALVGVGTRLGSGCTSGHGVCGIGRRSPRSLIATAVFMVVAIITVAVVGR